MNKRPAKAVLPIDPLKSAKAAGLRYVTGSGPGIRRRPWGKSFSYVGVDGKPVRDRAVLDRIAKLAIPPAWTDVWICPNPDGHIQAHGRDAKGRKQYRYHTAYREIRNQTKYSRMIAFGTALPGIRRRVREDLALPGLPKRKVVATVVRLLECTSIRVGNAEYVKHNNSFGLTTMRDRHVEIDKDRLKFHFIGKSGKEHDIQLQDGRLARIVKQCRDIPGFELFQFIDDDGAHCPIDSADVNDYVREISGEDFTAKDFRTWNGTVLAAIELGACGPCSSKGTTKRNIIGAIKRVAQHLGNRPATCRNYYVHPAVTEAYEDGTLVDVMKQGSKRAPVDPADELSQEELCVLALMKHRAQMPQTAPATRRKIA
jgi:DNA topoisomerase-1